MNCCDKCKDNLEYKRHTICPCECHSGWKIEATPTQNSWEEEFDKLEGSHFISRETAYLFISNLIKKERERIMEVIKNGGVPETISTWQHNGETYINERQLLKALSNPEVK